MIARRSGLGGTGKKVNLGVGDRILHDEEPHRAIGDAVHKHLSTFIADAAHAQDPAFEVVSHDGLEREYFLGLPRQDAAMAEYALEVAEVVVAQ